MSVGFHIVKLHSRRFNRQCSVIRWLTATRVGTGLIQSYGVFANIRTTPSAVNMGSSYQYSRFAGFLLQQMIADENSPSRNQSKTGHQRLSDNCGASQRPLPFHRV